MKRILGKHQPVRVLRKAQDILGFQVKVKDALTVHVIHSLADLAQEMNAVSLSEDKVFPNHPLKQFSSADTGKDCGGGGGVEIHLTRGLTIPKVKSN